MTNAAASRTTRFTELHRAIEGVSQRMLTLTLHQLERDGLVLRTVYPVVPPRVEYSLTDPGTTLLQPLVGLGTWAADHLSDIVAARGEYEQRVADNPTPWLPPAKR